LLRFANRFVLVQDSILQAVMVVLSSMSADDQQQLGNNHDDDKYSIMEYGPLPCRCNTCMLEGCQQCLFGFDEAVDILSSVWHDRCKEVQCDSILFLHKVTRPLGTRRCWACLCAHAGVIPVISSEVSDWLAGLKPVPACQCPVVKLDNLRSYVRSELARAFTSFTATTSSSMRPIPTPRPSGATINADDDDFEAGLADIGVKVTDFFDAPAAS